MLYTIKYVFTRQNNNSNKICNVFSARLESHKYSKLCHEQKAERRKKKLNKEELQFGIEGRVSFHQMT